MKRDVVPTSIRLDRALAKRVAHECIDRESNLTEAIHEGLLMWLGEQAQTFPRIGDDEAYLIQKREKIVAHSIDVVQQFVKDVVYAAEKSLSGGVERGKLESETGGATGRGRGGRGRDSGAKTG